MVTIRRGFASLASLAMLLTAIGCSRSGSNTGAGSD